MLRISSESLKNVTEGHNQAVIYGIRECHYREVAEIMCADNYDAYTYAGGGSTLRGVLFDREMLGVHKQNASNNDKINAKAIIANLMLENFKRSSKGLPIVPLIFCIEFESRSTKFKFDLHLLTNHYLVTSAELRRCYKIYAEFEGQFSDIVEKTCKFVRVVQDKNDESLYHLMSLPRIWKDPSWDKVCKGKLSKPNHKTPQIKSGWHHILFAKTQEYVAESDPVGLCSKFGETPKQLVALLWTAACDRHALPEDVPASSGDDSRLLDDFIYLRKLALVEMISNENNRFSRGYKSVLTQALHRAHPDMDEKIDIETLKKMQ
jgi:hypothetical protein